jgi:transposase
MDVIHDRVAGLDVHKDTVVACLRTMPGNRATRECRTYETTTEGLSALLEWLNSSRCGLAAMEATGVYWLPVWKILSAGAFELVLANAGPIKAVPGRKTDVNDAMWIADLAAHGLIKASFVPGEDRQELRTLTRTRKQLVREQTRHVQRIQKTLTEANIRLDSALSDIMGMSERRMIEAMIKGVRGGGVDPDRHLSHAQGRNLPSRPRRRLLRPALARVESQAPRPPNRQTRIPRHPSAPHQRRIERRDKDHEKSTACSIVSF